MSINIGQAACEAARSLNNNPDWQSIRLAIEEQVKHATYTLLDMDPTRVEHARGYAKAIFDLHRAFEAASLGIRQTAVVKPQPGRPPNKATQQELSLNA